MEIDDCKPSTSSTIDGPCDSNASSSVHVEKKEEDDDDDSEFYFESEHLALKGNKDYLNLLKTISILEAQRVKAIEVSIPNLSCSFLYIQTCRHFCHLLDVQDNILE